jgi:hypothetical protein
MITYLILFYLTASATWLFYVAIMHLRLVQNTEGLTLPQKVMGYPLLIVGLILDVILNLVFVTVLLLDFPRELLTTSRFRRFRHDKGWRGRQVRWWCRHFLEPFDSGHCG